MWLTLAEPTLRPAKVKATELADQHTDVSTADISPSPCITGMMIELTFGSIYQPDGVPDKKEGKATSDPNADIIFSDGAFLFEDCCRPHSMCPFHIVE